MKNIIGKLWALPTTVVFGLTFGLLGVCFAPKKVRIRIAHNAICFYNHPFLKGNYAGLTLGNVINFQGSDDYFYGNDVAEHERQHTLQAEFLGPLYIPLHAFYFLKYRQKPWQNPLERGPYSNPPRPW